MYYGYYHMSGYYMVGMILVLIGTVLMIGAQAKVSSAYRRYSKISNDRGLTGYQVAREILDSHGLRDIEIHQVSGTLSDHYHPGKRTLNLSNGIYDGHSIASLAVAAHECGHALQHQEGYKPLIFRNALVPFCNIGQSLGWIALFAGLALGNTKIAWVGVILMSVILLFQIVTLPVEFDASARALSILNDRYLYSDEYNGAKSMLTAAALTYVAGMLSTLLSLLRVVLIVIGNDRD